MRQRSQTRPSERALGPPRMGHPPPPLRWAPLRWGHPPLPWGHPPSPLRWGHPPSNATFAMAPLRWGHPPSPLRWGHPPSPLRWGSAMGHPPLPWEVCHGTPTVERLGLPWNTHRRLCDGDTHRYHGDTHRRTPVPWGHPPWVCHGTPTVAMGGLPWDTHRYHGDTHRRTPGASALGGSAMGHPPSPLRWGHPPWVCHRRTPGSAMGHPPSPLRWGLPWDTHRRTPGVCHGTPTVERLRLCHGDTHRRTPGASALGATPPRAVQWDTYHRAAGVQDPIPAAVYGAVVCCRRCELDCGEWRNRNPCW